MIGRAASSGLGCRAATRPMPISSAIAFEDGHATLFRAEDDVRERIEVFQPQLPALAGLTRRVKASFDPNGVFNHGRMYKDI